MRISSAVFVQTNGFGASLVIATYSRIAVSRARTLRCAPCLICFWLKSANQRSTRLSHEALVGVKWMKTWVPSEPPPDARRLVGPVLIEDEMHLQIRGDAGLDRLQELQELLTSQNRHCCMRDRRFGGARLRSWSTQSSRIQYWVSSACTWASSPQKWTRHCSRRS